VPAGDVARAKTVAAHITELAQMLHHHHQGEDELLWPRLNQRVALRRALIDRMEEEHAAVSRLIQETEELVPSWAGTADVEARDRLAGVLQELSAALDAHLEEEEREVLPLVREHITGAEWAELGERGMGTSSRTPRPRSGRRS
jgi:hemerythrin-like domain-containing protein